jgi:hypothetical protein
MRWFWADVLQGDRVPLLLGGLVSGIPLGLGGTLNARGQWGNWPLAGDSAGTSTEDAFKKGFLQTHPHMLQYRLLQHTVLGNSYILLYLSGGIRVSAAFKSMHEHQMTDEEQFGMTGLVWLLAGHQIRGFCLHRMAWLL